MNGVGKCYSATLCSACNSSILLHWCLTERNRSAVLLLQAQMDLSCRRCPKYGKQSFHGADVLAPGRSELGTVWLFGGKSQLVGTPLEQKKLSLEVGGKHSVTMHKVSIIGLSTSISAATPDRCAVLSSGVDQSKFDCT